jgi:hypothetical protein
MDVNIRKLLIKQVANQIVKDVDNNTFAPLNLLLQDVPSATLESFIPKEK